MQVVGSVQEIDEHANDTCIFKTKLLLKLLHSIFVRRSILLGSHKVIRKRTGVALDLEIRELVDVNRRKKAGDDQCNVAGLINCDIKVGRLSHSGLKIPMTCPSRSTSKRLDIASSNCLRISSLVEKYN